MGKCRLALPAVVSLLGVGDSYREVPVLLKVTLVYPVLLTNGPHTGAYRSGEHLKLRGLPRISRADVADFILSQVQDPTYSRAAAVVTSGK